MCTLLHRTVSYRSHQAYLAIQSRCNQNNAVAQLLFQLIAQITQTVHVYILNLNCQQLHAVYILYLVHNIAQRVVRQLTF